MLQIKSDEKDLKLSEVIPEGKGGEGSLFNFQDLRLHILGQQ